MKSNRPLLVASALLASACAAGVTPAGPGSGASGSTSGATGGGPGASAGSGSVAGSTSGTSSTSGGAGGSLSGTSSTSGGAGGSLSATSSSTGAGAGGDTTSSMLPLIVSTRFAPTGYMGDGATPGAIVMQPLTPTDPQDCNGDRSPPALGVCYTVAYVPVAGGQGWGGVYWQYPANNWGAMPGFAVPAGATQVTLWAKGAAGGEVVTLVAGGISGMAYEDSFKEDTTATLTTSWAPYTIPLPASYGAVLGGFAWSTTAPAGGATVGFSIDSIEWQ